MLGWKELTAKTENFFNTLPDSAKASTLIYCRNYGLAGSMKYYGASAYFRNKVISANGTFLLWIPDRIYFKNLILIDEDLPGKDEEVFQHFGKTTVIDSCTNSLSRQYGIKIIYFENASDSARLLAAKELRLAKAIFTR